MSALLPNGLTLADLEGAVHSDISMADYHNGPGVSSSGIKQLLRSPLHYAKRAEFQQTPALLIGSAAHVRILEPELYPSQYAVWDGPDKRTKAGKDAWAAFQEEHDGKEILTADQSAQVEAMAEAVFAHPAAKLLTDGAREQSVYWRDKDSGVLCKCRPDYLRADGTIIDLKTAISAERDAFQRAAFNFGYHTSGDFYLEGVREVLGVADAPFVFLVVEKEPPYAVAVYVLSADQANLGRRQWRRGLEIYAECERTGQWPGYPTAIEPLGLPAWAARQLEYEESNL